MAQYLMTTLFHLLICVGAVFSSPIKPLIVEQKTVVFGLISCIGVFSLVGACLFCKRRKRKFEKLENEAFQSAPICSGNANEYPIFHALTTSPPISAIIPQSATTRSSDNLLENASQNGITIEENARNDEDLENIPALHISQVHMEDELKYVSDIHDIHCIIKNEEANCKSNAIRETTCLDVFGDTNFSSIMQNFQNDSNAVNDNEQKFTRNSLRGSMESLSSVEEALRALDFVIDGADLSPDIISHKEPLSLTEVNNVAVIPISNDHGEKAEINYLAKTLIDDIMRNAISCIEAQRHIHNIQEQATDICTMEHDLFENFTKQVDLTSTPAIQKKYIGASELRSIEKKSLDFAEDTQLNHSSCPSINIETEKGKSDVEERPINTITPMNTPNEMLYQSNENWHKLIVVNLMQNQPADTGCCIESDPSNITFPNVKTVNNETFEKNK